MVTGNYYVVQFEAVSLLSRRCMMRNYGWRGKINVTCIVPYCVQLLMKM